MVVNMANMLHLIQFVKAYFITFHLSSPITCMFSQIPNRIEMIAQVEIHEEHLV
jgi:sulfur relay (sulfurtransferase) DsrC/TusE family protein